MLRTVPITRVKGGFGALYVPEDHRAAPTPYFWRALHAPWHALLSHTPRA